MTKIYKAFFLAFVVWIGARTETKAQECNIIYVTPFGATSGAAGTKQNPANLTYGLSLATSPQNIIYMRAGTYNVSNPVNLVSDVKIYGGFNTQWEKTNGSETIIFRDFSNVQPNPLRLVAVQGINISNFELHDLTIKTANAVGEGVSTYGLYLNGCSNYELVRIKVEAGSATNGSAGVAGINGLPGSAGSAGQNGDEDGPCCNLGGAPGSGSFPGSNPGGAGGNGGPRGTYSFPIGGSAPPGSPGFAAPGAGGGLPGLGGIGVDDRIVSLNVCPRTLINDGTAGTAGAPGLDGSNGLNGQATFAGGYFQPQAGTPGTNGTNGFGGGGGGGGGSQGYVASGFGFNFNGTGAGGGGGGEGGQHGTGGSGGTGGGGSFGLFLWNNGANTVIKDCFFQSGQYGLGGPGGLGGIGGNGGAGGQGGGQFNCDVGAGGNGGDGGKGGNGGKGGDGSDGISLAFYQSASGTPISVQNINSLQQPIVKVNYSACTNSPVTFSTNQTGTIQWFFGANSQPANQFGQTAVAYYTQPGEKTFTMVWNGIAYTYTEFINIISTSAPSLPQIQSSDSQLCVGATGTFSSSISADNYEWTITGGDNAINQQITGPGNQQIQYLFDVPGTYMIYLQTIDDCCGRSFVDSFQVQVEGLIQPSVVIQSIIETNGFNLCEGANVIFTATAANAGLTPGYQWFVNSVPQGSSSPTFVYTAPSQGDIVTCQVISSLGCSAGQTGLSNAIPINVIETPQVTCTSQVGFANQATFFQAEVVTGGLAPFTYHWNFGNNSFGSGSDVATVYPQAGSYNVQVDVTDDNGCTGSCNLVVLIENFLSVDFSTDVFNGCVPLPVQFTNESINAITYLWDFGDGQSSNQANPLHIYTSPGVYDVTLSGFSQEGNLSQSVVSQIAVFPSPVANFSAYPQVVGQAGQTVFFTDNSLNAWTWYWNFGDGGTSTLQNPQHTYTQNGDYTVTLIVTNDYGCADTTTKNGFAQVHVGVLEIENNQLRIFPNPFKNEIFIQSDLPVESIKLTDVGGKSIPVSVTGKHTQNASVRVETKIAPGMYMLEVNGRIFKVVSN